MVVCTARSGRLDPTLAFGKRERAKIRSVMSAIFSHAMRYEWLNRNPITLVRQSAKRKRLPDVLTAEEIGGLLCEQWDPCRTAVLLAATTGLGVSDCWP
jgi:integrase